MLTAKQPRAPYRSGLMRVWLSALMAYVGRLPAKGWSGNAHELKAKLWGMTSLLSARRALAVFPQNPKLVAVLAHMADEFAALGFAATARVTRRKCPVCHRRHRRHGMRVTFTRIEFPEPITGDNI